MSDETKPTITGPRQEQHRPRDAGSDEPEILVLPEPGQYTFDATGGRPILQYATYPPHGDTWLLWYISDPDAPSPTICEHVIGGRVEDIDWALQQARDHVRRFRQRESAPRSIVRDCSSTD